MRGPHVVTVRSNKVDSVVSDVDGSGRLGAATTVDDLFVLVLLAEQAGEQVIVEYDPDLGYPRDVIVDPEAVAVDGGLSLSVSDLQIIEYWPLRPGIPTCPTAGPSDTYGWSDG